ALVASGTAPRRGPAGPPPTLAGCDVFPADHVWNVRVDHLPVHPSSAAWVATIGADRPVHPDFGSGLWEGAPIGIPYTVVDGSQPRVAVSFTWADASGPGPSPEPPDPPVDGAPPGGHARGRHWPVPAAAPVEGAPPWGVAAGGDRHVLVVDASACVLYELFAAVRQPDGSWRAGSGAVFDLGGYELRPDGWTSADAAGLPILPGLVRYDEVAAGEIGHALRFTAPRTRAAHVWPARHHASDLTGPEYPPMGQRFRLRADFDDTGFSDEARVIVTALKRYGIVLADNGSAWYLSGAPDERWDDDALRDLRRVTGADFEAVD